MKITGMIREPPRSAIAASTAQKQLKKHLFWLKRANYFETLLQCAATDQSYFETFLQRAATNQSYFETLLQCAATNQSYFETFLQRAATNQSKNRKITSTINLKTYD